MSTTLFINIKTDLFNNITTKEDIKNYIMEQDIDYYNDIKIGYIKHIGSHSISIFLNDNTFVGGGVFTKNLFSGTSHEIMGFDDSKLYKSFIFNTEAKYYLTILGKNIDNNNYAICNVKRWTKDLTEDIIEVKINIPSDDYFIVIKELDNNYSYKSYTPYPTYFYDIYENDITEHMN